MMLADDAVQAYTQEQLISTKNREEETKKDIEEFIKAIKERFGDKFDIETLFEGGDIFFFIDGLKMRVARSQGYHDIYLVQKCSKCGIEYEDQIINLRDIGKSLQEGHSSYECGRVLEEKSQKKEPTTGEKLLDALRQFILENGESL